MKKVSDLKVQIFADGAEIAVISQMAQKPYIKGFTTNPTLMRKAGIADYKPFALEVLKVVPTLPLSFEVFSDDFAEMEKQALEIASWGKNVYVKIPITNTKGEPAAPLVAKLAKAKVQVNVTAIMTLDQVKETVAALQPDVASYVSVFAGRIADTGVDPLPLMQECLRVMAPNPKAELIWASPRELLNVFQADDIGCHVITVTPDILNKLALVGKDLGVYSLETVKMFYNDATAAGFSISTK